MSRLIEDIGFALGCLGAFGYVVSETLGLLGYSLGECRHAHGIPWGLVIMVTALVLPKTVGSATAGKIWEILPFGGNK